MNDVGSIRLKDNLDPNFDRLARLAISMGAGNAGIIASHEISVEDSLAKLCNEPPCENYGLSASCPPYVSGPSGFRNLQKALEYALVVRIIIPSAVFFSDERKEVWRLLHEIVAGVETTAVGLGYPDSKAFAASSCKKVFCHGHSECRRLYGNGECRYPQYARPSMSGFGINVPKLMQSCGWSGDLGTPETGSDSESMTWVAGLVMIG